MPPLVPSATSLLLWAQANAPAGADPAAAGPAASPIPDWLMWLFVWGEPAVTVPGALGGLITWLKVVGLFCLLAWAGSWVVTALKEKQSLLGRSRGAAWLDVAALAAVALGVVAALLSVLQAANRLPAGLRVAPLALGWLSAGVMLVWIESRLWGVIARKGSRGERLLLAGLHVALALGFGVRLALRQLSGEAIPVPAALSLGGRLGVTYMGLLVLARVVTQVLPELGSLQARRLYAIAWHSWVEAFRRMWAPWVVIVIFAVILAFTSWFLQPPRPAELGRLYVGTLMLLTSILLTLTVVFLAPISIPNDIRQQTIYTIVSKPVRRLEMIWGRILGYMGLVTVLLLLFGGISLLYYYRQVNAAIRETLVVAEQAQKDGQVERERQAREQASQLRTRMGARVPIKGSLIFYDSRNRQRRQGIDVGIELPTRSFVEGATPSRAIWRYGPAIPNPRNETEILDRRIPVESLLQAGTIEAVENEAYALRDRVAVAQAKSTTAALKSAGADEARLKDLEAQLANLRRQEQQLRRDGKAKEAQDLHSPPLPLEMTFNVYRTTKGEVGEPVYASLVVTNPRPGSTPFRDVFPIREYYTNKRAIPASLLVGSRGQMDVEVKCLSANQYLGMAEGDLFLLARQGSFWANYLRGLLGIWLQAMVLTAIGVCAGTFLSWPVALLTTIFFFVAGNIGFSALQQFALSAEMVGGGPFESLIRMLTHDNLMTQLEPTAAVVTAKTLDSIVMPVMSRLVYLVPNFQALDVSNVVADGFSVSAGTLLRHVLLALAYALPFSIAAYFILRHREVAA
jgi:hypothetical protein